MYVTVININYGHNIELLEQCQLLKEYTQYVACVRDYQKDYGLEDAVEHAVNDCIKKGISKKKPSGGIEDRKEFNVKTVQKQLYEEFQLV